jgi:protein CLEC16A
MGQFIVLSCLDNRNISLQIIKSFSVLILNTSNTTTLYYLFSNNFINQIISNDYEKYDDEFLSYYVNFLKSLSLKLDTNTIQFFFRSQHNSFPLLQAALKLYNHSDNMIKNTVRNIVLTLLKSNKY